MSRASPNPPYRGGTGDPLVLIHGGAGTWRQWGPVIPHLEAHHQVLAVNLVGHWGGRAPAPGAPTDLDALVDGVASNMDELGWHTAHLAGTSLGGLLTLVLANRGRARTCTAIATVAGWNRNDPRLRLVARSYRGFHTAARLIARNPARWVRRPRLRRFLFWHHFARPERMDPVDTAQMIVGVANCTILPDLFAWAREHGPPTGFDRIRCPIQLLFPTEDRLFPRRRYGAQLLAAVPGAEAHDLLGAGHVATWDEPELVAERILALTLRERLNVAGS